MNILFLDQFSDLGGAQQNLLDLLPAIRKHGWKALVAAPGSGPLADRSRASGVPYAELSIGPFRSWKKSAIDVLRFLLQARALTRRIALLVEVLEANLIYVNGPRLLPAAARAASGRIPLVFHCHSLLRPGYPAVLVGRALRRSRAALIGNCRFVLQPLQQYATGEVVYNGVPAPAGASLRKSGSTFTAGVIGRIAPEKGQAEFVQAARTVARTHPDCRFVVCGAAMFDDPGAARYERQVRQAAADLPVEFLGWRSDAAQVLAGMDLLIVPSAGREATTRVVFEAFAAGVPVLACNSGGLPEIIRDRVTGYLAPPGDPAALARQMCAVIESDPSQRAQIAEAARQEWRGRYTLDQYQRSILAILERVGSSA